MLSINNIIQMKDLEKKEFLVLNETKNDQNRNRNLSDFDS
jgi:hypothetical protein